MAKVNERTITVCSDCDDTIYNCHGCGSCFQNNQEVICQEDSFEQKHYCMNCVNKGLLKLEE